MPPKTRGGKNSKASKENIGANTKSKSKTTGKVTKPPRKVLADKTNSASDDNASIVTSKPTTKRDSKVEENLLCKQRPRRDRRLPTRFVENNVLQNLSNSQNASIESQEPPKNTPVKKVLNVILSPLKSPERLLESSLNAKRPKRICRLPSKFDDHSISPSKFIPVQPVHASTPKVLNKGSKVIEKEINKQSSPKKAPASEKVISTKINKKKTVQKKINNTSKNNSADTNNNPKQDVRLPQKKTKNTLTTAKQSPEPKSASNKKITDKNSSFRVLEDRKSLKRDASKIDVYEFTFDPNEEPPPQKKKRKRPAKKKEPKPKTVTFKNNYDKNVAKALSALRNKVTIKTTNPPSTDNMTVQVNKANEQKEQIHSNVNVEKIVSGSTNANVKQQSTSVAVGNKPSLINVITEPSVITANKSNVSQKNYNSVRVEDIALDFEENSVADDINYSPINSPCRPITPAETEDNQHGDRSVHNDDPLNLRDDVSFFDDVPVASSSMMSVRHPTASPWRAEFEKLPIKWQVNTYVKPNMTPALESSFINSSDSKKKHVYTNMVVDTDDANSPHIFEDNTASKLKQTSIISFIKEVAERKEKKRKEKLTPIKANSLFESMNNTSVCMEPEPEPVVQNNPVTPAKNNATNECGAPENLPATDTSSEKDTSADSSKEVNKDSSTESAKKSNKKKKDKNITYFGFDDCENENSENVSPTKKIDKRKLRAMRPRSRAVLQEINAQKGPMRPILPVAAKSKPIQSSDTVNKLFDEVRSGTEPPVFPDKEAVQTQVETANVTEVQPIEDANNDDFQSVHLFEDLEVVHHMKPHRKSYGKSKKVTFRQNSISDSDIPTSDIGDQAGSSDEDDLHDLTFKIPAMETKKTTRKKKTKKQKLSKKEQKEAEAWAAGFNSMCEDIEEFDLVVE